METYRCSCTICGWQGRSSDPLIAARHSASGVVDASFARGRPDFFFDQRACAARRAIAVR